MDITPRYAINIADWGEGSYLIEVFVDGVEKARMWCKADHEDWLNIEYQPDWIDDVLGLKICILKCVMLAHKGHLPEYWVYNRVEAIKALRNELILI